ncbi:MAG: hypothetical protein GY910_25185 [bacterium]|nr:hypothetical protein [bacterium]
MSGSESPPSVDSAAVLVAMLRRMLRPLVRFLVSRQVQYPLVSRLLKSLYVEVATSDFPLEDKRLTVSRLSLLTGIHRREVKRIQEQAAPGEAPTPPAITLGAQIVARWTGEAPWIDDEGRPRPLRRQSDEGDIPSFQRLVNSVSVDIHPRSVLDEWLRLGIASIDEDGAVALKSEAFVPSRGFEEKAHYVGRNLRDHLAAAAGNLDSDESPFLERSVHYGSLPSAAVEELSELAREAGQEVLVRINDRARELKRGAAERGESEGLDHRRITFGVYEFDAPTNEGAGEVSGSSAERALNEVPEGGGDAD